MFCAWAVVAALAPHLLETAGAEEVRKEFPPFEKSALGKALSEGGAPAKAEARERPAEGIQDNSFLIEEAYNQPPGVVQHIFTFAWEVDKLHGPDDRRFAAAFTQEWPVLSERHQLSYTVPYARVWTGGRTDQGLEDVQLHYRYQALMDEGVRPAFAPRISFLLPSGDEDRGFGNGKVGYQVNLPASKVVADRWTLHFNAGATYIPRVSFDREDGGTVRKSLSHVNAGASAIFAATAHFNLMLEFAGYWDQQFSARGTRRRDFSAVLAPGFRYGIDLPKARDAQLVIGAAAPIGLNARAPDFGGLLYISFEHNF